MDKQKAFLFAWVMGIFLLGAIFGALAVYWLSLHAIEAIGQSFKVENMNLTVQLNQSMLMDALERINQSKATP